jgi:hypothetical protein
MATVLATAEADFLSFVNDEEEICMSSKEEILLLDDLGSVGSDYPLRARVIALEQQRDAWLQRAIPRHPTYFQRKIVEGTELVLFHKMIYIPVSLRERVLAWYHDNLCHPGTKRTERTIRMHLIWPGLSESVETYVKRCPICQTCKATRPKYGHLPLPERELHPWHTVCVDLVGPLTVMASDGKERVLNALTMADPSTGWFEIVEASDKKALTVAKLFDLTWLCRYPRPVRVIHDHGSEFIGEEFVELLQSYGIASVPTTVNNPQANFVERVHQTLWNMLRSQELTTYEFPESKPWDELLGKCAWAIRSTAHLVTDTSPAELIFGRDMIFDLSARVSWKDVKRRREEASQRNNERENAKRLPYKYKEGDMVLLHKGGIRRKLYAPREGPYRIQTVYSNGIVKIQKGIVSQKVSIRRISPFRT